MVEIIDNNKDEVREQILETARGIFGRFGFKKTTVDEIAQAAHKGKSSLYYYFKSKEEIFEAVIDKEADSLRRKLLEIVDSGIDPEEKIKQYVIIRMSNFRELINYYEAMKNEYLSHLPFIEKVRGKYDEEEIKVFEKLLQEGVDKKKFQLDDVGLAAVAIVTAMKGLEIPLFITYDISIENKIKSLLNILFYGIVKK